MIPKNVFFLLFDSVEILDFSGPYDVLTIANKHAGTPLTLNTIAAEKNPIQTAGGLSINPDYGFAEDHPKIDLLIIPGSPNFKEFEPFEREIEWISQQQGVEAMVSICVGAVLLLKGRGKRLNGHQITSHHEAISFLEEIAHQLKSSVEILAGPRYVDSHGIFSSAGVSAGIDLAFYLVEKFLGREVAQFTTNIMEYNRTINWALETEQVLNES